MNYLIRLLKLTLCQFLLVSSLVLAEHDSASNHTEVIQKEGQLFTTPDYNGDLTERSALLGSFDGQRQELANQGITLDGNLTQVDQGVVSGGRESGEDYMGRGEVNLNLDTAKMGLWPGGLITITGEGNFGHSLNKKTGTLLGVNANDLFPQEENSFVIPNATYTQFLSKKFGIAVGKFATVTSTTGDMNEFAHGKGSEQFMNPNFNLNPVIALTVPYSTLGLTGIYIPNEDLILTLGVLDPHGEPDKSGFSDFFENGATIASEARLTTDFFDMTGHQLLGFTYSTSDYVDLDQRAANLIFPGLPIQQADGSWSVTWNADQYFYQPVQGQDRGAGVFARYGMSDGDANPIANFASIGLGAKGLIDGREHDRFGLGLFRSWTADNRITDQAGFGDSQGMETYYEYAVTPAVHLTPSLQWVEPSQQRVDSSWILGLRMFTVF